MVDFGKTDYFHSMDQKKEKIPISIKDFGSSARIGDVLQSLKGELVTGASHVELVFLGTGKGSLSQGNTNPETFDKRKREEIRQLSKINGVTLSTHASVQKAGWSGFNPQARAFSKREATDSLIELKRTIDFAADAASGGAVVVHTNEFPRNIKDEQFKLGDEKEEVVYLANAETGEIVNFSKAQVIHMPEWKKNDKGQYVDINGKAIKDPDDFLSRVPVLDDKGNIKKNFSQKTYADIKEEVDAWNKGKSKDQHRNADLVFFKYLQRENKEKTYAMGNSYYSQYARVKERIEEVEKKVNDWKYFEKNIESKEKLEQLKEDFETMMSARSADRVKLKEGQNPSDWWEKRLNELKEDAVRSKEGYFGYQKELEKMERVENLIKPIEEVGVERSAKTFAQAAMYAFEVEKQKEKAGKKLDRDIYICPENMFAEWGYGGHPDELRKLVVQSREEMKKLLAKKGIKGKKAQKIADGHIKATWDVGHANTWSKYFEQDPNLSPEENKKKFDKWMIGEVDKLVKDGILGHVHMSDNFGYFDEHLNAGQGNAPLQDFLQTLKSNKYEGDIIVEWGSQGADEPSGAMLQAWANMANSPVYRVEGGKVAPTWSDIEHGGYFGGASSPNITVGRYATSLGRDWQLWSYSEAPIE